MSEKLTKFKQFAFNVLAIVLCVYVLLAVNRDLLDKILPYPIGTGVEAVAAGAADADGEAQPVADADGNPAKAKTRRKPGLLSTFVPADDQPKLAIFGMLGLALVFLGFPTLKRWESNPALQLLDLLLVAAAFGVYGYIFVQSEDLFRQYWIEGQTIGERASAEKPFEFTIGLIGILLILEATRRSIGLILPLLCLAFVMYAFKGQEMPDWFFPHRGLSWQQLTQGSFLQSGTMCVFGIALNVMFKYVFLFVLFGTLLEQTGATSYIINFARGLFRSSAGGPAKVAVVSSGLMGSLSGSAVANTATTGSFTIPLMKSTGFTAETAAGIEAAASSGGALMPPIMGAGAYMMLEILGSIEPDMTYLKIVRAAAIPAILYYVALLLSVHFHAKKIGAAAELDAASEASGERESSFFQGFVFFGSFVILITLLLLGKTPFLAVSISLVGICVLAGLHPSTRVGPKKIGTAMLAAAKGGTSLIVAASCVGIILGAVSMTGLGPALPAKVQLLAGDSAVLALLLLMASTIILGMGLPSAVCYLLVALTVSSVLSVLDTPPLAAHLFIFYFGMMSMVTPPVALAAYAGAAIANANIIKSAFEAFRFALVGFALPFSFVFKPELLMLTHDNQAASIIMILVVVGLTLVAIVGLAASVAGYAFSHLTWAVRILLMVGSLLIFFCRLTGVQAWIQIGAAVAVVIMLGLNFQRRNTALAGEVPATT